MSRPTSIFLSLFLGLVCVLVRNELLSSFCSQLCIISSFHLLRAILLEPSVSQPATQHIPTTILPNFQSCTAQPKSTTKIPMNTIAIAFWCHYANSMQFYVYSLLSCWSRSPRGHTVCVCTESVRVVIVYVQCHPWEKDTSLAFLHPLPSTGIQALNGLWCPPTKRSMEKQSEKWSSYRN